jgi:hypothetical protein
MLLGSKGGGGGIVARLQQQTSRQAKAEKFLGTHKRIGMEG